MKILHVCQLYSPSVGGNQYHVQLLSEGLAAMGEEVHVFTSNVRESPGFHRRPEKSQILKQSEVIKNVRVRRFPVDYDKKRFYFEKLVKWPGGYRLLNMMTRNGIDILEHGPLLAGLQKAITRLKPDIMMAANGYSYTSYICHLVKKKANIPFVFTPITHSKKPWANHPVVIKMNNSADWIHACTPFERDFLIGQGIEGSKISVRPLGIPDEVQPGEDTETVRKRYGLKNDPVIAYFGRKIEGKGIQHLIDAMPHVWNRHPNAQLLLAGKQDVNFQKVIDLHIQQAGADARIVQVDDFDPSAKKALYQLSDVVAMTSHIDAFGLVYLEAWKNAKPVVACRKTPQETIIDDGINGRLVDYGDIRELSETLIDMLDNPRKTSLMGHKGKEKQQKVYSLDYFVRSVHQDYKKLVASR